MVCRSMKPNHILIAFLLAGMAEVISAQVDELKDAPVSVRGIAMIEPFVGLPNFENIKDCDKENKIRNG